MHQKVRNIVLLVSLLLGASRATAQQAQFTAPDCEFSFRFAVVNSIVVAPARIPVEPAQVGPPAQVTVGYDNRFKNCVTWTMVYHVDGPGALSIELDEAFTSAGLPGSWSIWPTTATAPGTVQPITSTGASQVSTFLYFPWVSVVLNSATGNGQIEGHVYGWRAAPGQDSSQAGNSVFIAGNKYTHISTAANTQVKATPGVLHAMIINTSAAGAITVVDTSAANCTGGTTIAILPASAAVGNYLYDVSLVNGLCIITGAASDITVSSR